MKLEDQVKDFKDFAARELSLYNTLFEKNGGIPRLPLGRAQIRLMLAAQHIQHGIKENPTEDYLFLIESILLICKREGYKADIRLLHMERRLMEGENCLSHKLTKDQTHTERKFLYSICDFLRTVEFESDGPAIIDLTKFAMITDKFLPKEPLKKKKCTQEKI